MLHTTPLTLNKEYKRAYYRGRSFATPVVVVYVVKNRLKANRLGLTASKKVGKAVRRNRARRVMKEAYRLLEGEFPMGYDLVLVARTKTPYVSTNEIIRALRAAMKKLFPQNP